MLAAALDADLIDWNSALNETVDAVFAPDVLVRLRAETRSEHDAIEDTLNLTGEDITLADYRYRLEQFYGFYRPMENRMRSVDDWLAPWLDAKERRKTSLLKEDLHLLGCSSPDSLSMCMDLPLLKDPAAYFGCLYVLEGATLGGQVISRHIHKKLGLTAATGGRFFEGYGSRTGFMWQQFRAAIGQFASSKDLQDSAIAAARSTFDRLNQWCQRKNLS